MKYIFYVFLYLNIYTLFLQQGYAQNLYLEIAAEKPISEDLKDSLDIPENFSDFRAIQNEVDSLQKNLESFGYLNSRLESLRKKNDSIFIAEYFFGTRYKYLKIYYDPVLFSKKELASISEEVTENYFILSFENTERALQKLNAIKAGSGSPFATIKLGDFTYEGSSIVVARILLESGEKRTVDSIAIKGYEKFPVAFLKHYAGIKKGRAFDREKLTRKNEVINSLGFVRTIKPPEVLFRVNSTTLFLYLEKRNNNLFDGILGFATDEETNKLEFNGYLNLELNNNLHFGEQLLINYKADGAEQQNFRAKVKMPYLFGSPFGSQLELKIFKRDSTFITTDQSVKVSYQINPASAAYIGYKSAESSNLLDDILAGTSVEDYKAKFLLLGLQFSKNQNDALFPIKTSVVINSEIGSRELMATTESQTRLELSAANIFNLNYENSIFLNNTTGVLLSETFVTNELFRFGGINSIRGFNENSIDASLYAVLNTEYRYRFSPGFYLHSIIDLAYFENETITIKQKLYSFGIGLGLLTKAGLLKFNIANGNLEKQNFNFSNTKIHLSLSSRF